MQNSNGIKEQYQAAAQRKNWLAKYAGRYLISPERWGQAISQDMVNNLKKAGLEKLWLGFDNWMPAFYQPQAIDQAKEAGYLVGTYDSYNTAIPPPVLMTLGLPRSFHTKCAKYVPSKKPMVKNKKGFAAMAFT